GLRDVHDVDGGSIQIYPKALRELQEMRKCPQTIPLMRPQLIPPPIFAILAIPATNLKMIFPESKSLQSDRPRSYRPGAATTSPGVPCAAASPVTVTTITTGQLADGAHR